MAMGLEKLEKKLDQLEKFFTKKKRGSTRDSLVIYSTPNSPLSLLGKSNSGGQTFPEPSFIRPTSTRMFAREEVNKVSRPAQRSNSLPESPSPPGLMTLATPRETAAEPDSSTSCQPPRIPKRSSSLSPTRRPASLASLAELLEFGFGSSPRQREQASSSPKSRSRSGSISPKAQPNRKSHPHIPQGQQQPLQQDQRHQQLATPPPSAEYNKSFSSAQMAYQKDLPAIPPPGGPTPEPSPRLVPLPEPEFDELEVKQDAESQRPKSLDVSASVERATRIALHRSISLSSLTTAKSPSKIDPILKEPTFNDFFSLSDDDIADDTPAAVAPPPRAATPPPRAVSPPTCALPPDPPVVMSASPQVSAGTRLLTLSPPLATRPATAAAFEAARIAARYKFDLVYVVNLWPNHMGSVRSPTLAKSPLSPTSPAAEGGSIDGPSPTSPHIPRAGMTGRLLAAYGLPFIMSPFRISASVHLKVLRSEGWLEYRCDTAAPGEFTRGYSCSFYTGHSPDSRGGPAEGSTRKRRGTAPNRGVVFAAYRLPRADGGTADSNLAELVALGKDAETLVNMLIDIHKTQRKRRPVASKTVKCTTLVVGEAGPLSVPNAAGALLAAV